MVLGQIHSFSPEIKGNNIVEFFRGDTFLFI